MALEIEVTTVYRSRLPLEDGDSSGPIGPRDTFLRTFSFCQQCDGDGDGHGDGDGDGDGDGVVDGDDHNDVVVMDMETVVTMILLKV